MTVIECRPTLGPSTFHKADVSLKKKPKTKHLPAPQQPPPDWQAFTQGLFNAFMALKSLTGVSLHSPPPA